MLLRITRDGIERIKVANPIAAIVAERGIRLTRKGRNLFALCPLHEEDTPSFVVTEGKGLFHCFGCGAGGDVIGFVVRHDKITFPEALERLAARAGLSLEGLMQSPEPSRSDEPRIPGEDLCGRTSWR